MTRVQNTASGLDEEDKSDNKIIDSAFVSSQEEEQKSIALK